MSVETTNPKDWSDWEKYRDQVIHPTGTLKPQDLARAHENIQKHAWAQKYTDTLQDSANSIAREITPNYLEHMIEPTTPGCVGPCPACRAKGLPWHPNGQWDWSANAPDQLRCVVCKTVFPHADYPEDIVIESTWGKGQTFTFVGGDTFKCFAYHNARPSISGIIRVRKVGHVTQQLQTLSLAYALTQNATYAHAAKKILLRFADVFPEYLVRAGYGYGEYAGMDPHIAAEHILDLPKDELVYPPNKPDRKIFAGYWAASRIGTSGMDGGWVVRISDAYSLTCTAQENDTPIFTEEERKHIERDLILESTYLAACDTAINNKSVGNRAGAAIAGMCVGHPGLVHFGLDGFIKTVNDWFLPDGGTSESPAYAMMTMNGIRPFALAFRNYSDPKNYNVPNRLDNFDACRDTLYGDCWQALLWTLQGDLHFPPSADSYRQTSISVMYADLLALAYPTDAHIALLQERIAKDEDGGIHQNAVFHRDPNIGTKTPDPLALPDVLFPYLSQGHLRTGTTGRDSLALLNAADHANHHHIDGLNLYYWKDGHELLSDLGYLWDHPDKYQTARTASHNLAMINGKDQTGRGRHGTFHLFSITPTVKALEASSDGYGPEALYRRTVVQIDHDDHGSYLLDLFYASGGQTADYIFHGPHNTYQVHDLTLTDTETFDFGENGPELTDMKTGQSTNPWHVVWTFEDGYTFTAFTPKSNQETVFTGTGWGQRDHKNTDVGATLPYIVRHRKNKGNIPPFVTAFSGQQGDQSLIKSIEILPLPDNASHDAAAVAIHTTQGTDIVIHQLTPTDITVTTEMGNIRTDGQLSIVTNADQVTASVCLIGGTNLASPNAACASSHATLKGQIQNIGSENGNSYFDIDCDAKHLQDLIGQTLFTIDDTNKHGYPIRSIEPHNDGCRVFTKKNHEGFEARQATHWELPLTTSVSV